MSKIEKEVEVTLARICRGYKNEFNIAEWEDFQISFASEESCIDLLYKAKWPNGFSCPRCNHRYACVIQTRRLPLYQCYSCRHQTSLTVGTIMENSHTLLSKWLSAFYLVSRTDSLVNAIQLKERIKVTYKTAWAMLHAIRQAISKADTQQMLTGTIKGGIGFCGQISFNSTMRREPQEKPVIFGASTNKNGQPTLFKMKVVGNEHMNKKYLDRTGIREFAHKFVQGNLVTKEVEILQRFALHKILPVKNLFDQTMFTFIKLFRGLSSKHLQLYLDEASYRINLTLHNIPIFENLSRLCMSTILIKVPKHPCSHHQ